MKKREVSPDGSQDENVFDIQQGVAISLFIRQQHALPGPARVHYADLWGARSHKYAALADDDATTTHWINLEPTAPYYFFTPKNFAGKDEYEQFPSLTDTYPHHNAGIQTKRDGVVYQFTPAQLSEVIASFRSLSVDELRTKYELPPDGRDWTVADAKADIATRKGAPVQVAYHPFDPRWTWYSAKTKGFMAYPRHPLMQSALSPNKLLLAVRNARRGNLDSFFVANLPVDKDAVSPFDNATFFPLYVYPDPHSPTLPEFSAPSTAPGGRLSNIAEPTIERLCSLLHMSWVPDGKGDRIRTFGPEDVLSYIYAILYAPSYRERYAELLKIDFARVPFTNDPELFRQMCALGNRLIALHLMEMYARTITSYPITGSNLVEQVRYSEPGQGAEQGRVWINRTQYVEGVPPEVWEFHIGGYQVCEKWLKDRKGRVLSYDDLQHYQRVVVALSETRQIMEQIDEVIKEYGGWPLPGSVPDGLGSDSTTGS